MNQMERLFRDCHFSFNLPHPNDVIWRISYIDTSSHGSITILQIINIERINKERVKRAVRKLNQFANVLLEYMDCHSNYGHFDRLAVRKWLENTDWYMVERG